MADVRSIHAIAWFTASATARIAHDLADQGLLSDDAINHLHALLAVARKHIEALGDVDSESTLLALEQQLPFASRPPAP
ncbi:hypothetical protein [Sphingomonas sp. NFR15]|uniref:hypothetical protein n=1 Tax=Sphingomonas sp. NFR15 TaxID=1566282 RepID=UPI00115FFBF0|nr:hypothetical protein [Sphingomonas sp. NFR15]